MKKYAIPVVVVLVVLAVTWAAFGQAQDRAAMRERFQNMSEEERAKFREQMRARGGGARRNRMSPEAQQKAIKAIEEALVKVKAAAQIQRPQGGFQDMSEEERNKLMTAYRDRSTALNAIVAQVALLQGRMQPEAEGARFIIINTEDIKPIQEAATKEKAEETSQLLERLISRGRGFGRRPGGGGRPQGQR
ncbi:MAG: hypothetical protein ACYS14_03415 [Planctomycetota bacterium]|jgi:hypothetical protein